MEHGESRSPGHTQYRAVATRFEALRFDNMQQLINSREAWPLEGSVDMPPRNFRPSEIGNFKKQDSSWMTCCKMQP